MQRALLQYTYFDGKVFCSECGMFEVSLEEGTGRALWGQEKQQL